MRKSLEILTKLILFLLVLVVSEAVVATPLKVSVGAGVESRLQRDVNPDYASAQFAGQVYARFGSGQWALAAELTPAEGRDTGSGNFRIHTESTGVGLWSRYGLLSAPRFLSPFVGVGTGVYFDRITTEFAGSMDSRSTQRGFMGAGAGLTATLWTRLTLEAEARGLSLQQRGEPLYTLVIRAGLVM